MTNLRNSYSWFLVISKSFLKIALRNAIVVRRESLHKGLNCLYFPVGPLLFTKCKGYLLILLRLTESHSFFEDVMAYVALSYVRALDTVAIIDLVWSKSRPLKELDWLRRADVEDREEWIWIMCIRIFIVVYPFVFCVWDFLLDGVYYLCTLCVLFGPRAPAYIHCMQHTLISILIGDGGPSFSIQKMGGLV